MKSILIISNYLPPRNSGAGQRAYNHAIQLSKKGYNVHLISESPNGKNLLKKFRALENSQIVDISINYDAEMDRGIKRKLNL